MIICLLCYLLCYIMIYVSILCSCIITGHIIEVTEANETIYCQCNNNGTNYILTGIVHIYRHTSLGTRSIKLIYLDMIK